MTEDLRRHGFAIVKDFLPPETISDIRKDLLVSRSSMKPAGVGKDKSVASEIRRDEILWLDGTNLVRGNLLTAVDGLKNALNRELFLGLRAFEGHYAHYPAGGFYKRHLDRFRTDDARTVSLILYLNEGWREGDGGKLRLYTEGTHVDVEPRAGTLALFLSGEIEHEVLESFAPRLSFTGWFKT